MLPAGSFNGVGRPKRAGCLRDRLQARVSVPFAAAKLERLPGLPARSPYPRARACCKENISRWSRSESTSRRISLDLGRRPRSFRRSAPRTISAALLPWFATSRSSPQIASSSSRPGATSVPCCTRWRTRGSRSCWSIRGACAVSARGWASWPRPTRSMPACWLASGPPPIWLPRASREGSTGSWPA